MPDRFVLTDAERRFIEERRHAVLATTAPDGRARVVPSATRCRTSSTGSAGILYTPIDEKQKKTDNPREWPASATCSCCRS